MDDKTTHWVNCICSYSMELTLRRPDFGRVIYENNCQACGRNVMLSVSGAPQIENKDTKKEKKDG